MIYKLEDFFSATKNVAKRSTVGMLCMLGMCMSLQKADAQGSFFPFTKHYWLNELSYNHTLSFPTDATMPHGGKWLLAAAKQELGAARRNAIAVFRLDNFYREIDSRVIGLPMTGSDELDRNVEFEVSCVSESCDGAPDMRYVVVCGSMRRSPGGQQHGMVAILNATTLHPISIREYSNVKHFSYVYVRGDDFYVCGQTLDNRGIVLQDFGVVIAPTAHATNTPWEYHKIRQRTRECGDMLSVSGSNGNEIGFTNFHGSPGNFTSIANESWRFPTGRPINSKAVIANYPGFGSSGGLVLSVSDANNIYTYLFSNAQAMSSAFEMACKGGKLEDIECAQTPAYRVAWVGNFPQQRAYYISLDLPQLPPHPSPFPTTLTNIYYFDPFPATKDAYYSLHKIHYDRNGDQKFHAGGYFKQNIDNVNTTTFVVSPEQALDIPCQTEFCTITTDMIIPDVHPLILLNYTTIPAHHEPAYREYVFCEMGCEGGDDRCGNRLKRTTRKK